MLSLNLAGIQEGLVLTKDFHIVRAIFDDKSLDLEPIPKLSFCTIIGNMLVILMQDN